MTIISQRVKLIPLTLTQLEIGLKSTKELAADLNIPLVATLISGTVESAVTMKIEKMRAAPPDLHDWYTYWLIVVRDDNIGAGMVGFKGVPNDQGEVEIGYGIDPVFQGLGYMTEAVREMLCWAFSHPECQAVTATAVALDNYPSQKVLVKTGFVETGIDEKGVSYRHFRE